QLNVNHLAGRSEAQNTGRLAMLVGIAIHGKLGAGRLGGHGYGRAGRTHLGVGEHGSAGDTADFQIAVVARGEQLHVKHGVANGRLSRGQGRRGRRNRGRGRVGGRIGSHVGSYAGGRVVGDVSGRVVNGGRRSLGGCLFRQVQVLRPPG